MADVLKIFSQTGVHQIDLLGGTYKLRDGTWATSTPQIVADYNAVPYGAQSTFQNFLTQVETMDLIAQDTTHSTIRTAQRNISEALEEARMYNHHPLWTVHDATSGAEAVWLYWAIDGETEKKSLIYEGSLAGVNEQCAEPFISSNVSLLRMAITRHPFWEPTNSAQIYPTLISGWGGTYNFNNIGGDVWARFETMQLYGQGGSGPLYRTWMGIREEMAGTIHFEPIWQLENGVTHNGASNSTSRSGYSGSGHVRQSSPAVSLTKYVSITVDTVCAMAGHSDYNHQMGQYLVLCRCAVDSGTVGLQMRYGYAGGITTPSEEVFVTNTSWRLIELGRVTFPPVEFERGTVSNFMRYVTIEIYAEQVAGTSVLDLDALCLIPTHHFWQTEGASIGNSSSYSADIYTTPNDRYICFGQGAAYPRYSLEYSAENWYLPTGDSIVVVAGERENEHVLADNAGIYATYCLRWGMYRS